MKTKAQRVLGVTGAIYTVLNLTVPTSIESLEKAMNDASYIFGKKPEPKTSNEDAKARFNEFSTEVQSRFSLTTEENVQRIREGKQPY